MRDLATRAFRGLAILFLATAAPIFLAAGTLAYWQGWAFLLAYFAPALALTLYLVDCDPALLERRMTGGPTKEKRPAQRLAMSVVSLGFIALNLLPAFDRRFGWSEMAPPVALFGDTLVFAGWLAFFIVFRVNPFAASVVDVVEGQTVVSTGPYAYVRHPMYVGGFLMLLGIPIALGSWWGLLPLALMSPALIWRLLDEEKLLEENLPGYADYEATVRWRLLPMVW